MNYFQYNILSRGFICFVIYHSRMNEMTWEKYRHRMIAIITRRNALGLKIPSLKRRKFSRDLHDTVMNVYAGV